MWCETWPPFIVAFFIMCALSLCILACWFQYFFSTHMSCCLLGENIFYQYQDARHTAHTVFHLSLSLLTQSEFTLLLHIKLQRKVAFLAAHTSSLRWKTRAVHFRPFLSIDDFSVPKKVSSYSPTKKISKNNLCSKKSPHHEFTPILEPKKNDALIYI